MDIFFLIVFGLLALGVVAVLVMLARREARFRRLPESRHDADPGAEQVDARAAAYAAQMSRGVSSPF